MMTFLTAALNSSVVFFENHVLRFLSHDILLLLSKHFSLKDGLQEFVFDVIPYYIP
jgi:hypothetical protein